MNGGKWRYLMDAAPRRLPVFEDVHATLLTSHSSLHTPRIISACEYTEASAGVETIKMLGHSMNAVALPKGGKLTYSFSVERDGRYTVETALIPTQPNDNGDLRFCVAIDGGTPIIFTLKEPFRSEQWKQNVLRGQALREFKVHLSPAPHTITIQALDNHIVIDQLFIK